MDPKIRYSIHAALLFLIISSPFLYRLVQGILGAVFTVSGPSGCPTLFGLLLHAAVFGALVYFLMSVRY
jgi:hypothetical protein